MKKLVTFRIDPDLLDRAKVAADRENRTLTNYVETVLKRTLEAREGEGRSIGVGAKGADVSRNG